MITLGARARIFIQTGYQVGPNKIESSLGVLVSGPR